MFTWKFRKQRQLQSSQSPETFTPFCSRLYSSPIIYLLWSSILFATCNCLHDLCQRPLYQAIPGVSPFSPILKTSNWNKSAFVHQLERNHADLQRLKICPQCLYNSLPCPSLKKEGSKQNAGSPMKSLKRLYGFSYERMEKWEPWGSFGNIKLY